MPFQSLPWLLFALALGANGWLARRIGRTSRTRWLIFGLYSLLLIGLVAFVAVLLIVIDHVFTSLLDAPTRARIVAGAAGFWLVAVVLASLRVRKYHE